MKNIFGIEKESNKIDGNYYLDREISIELQKELEETSNILDEINKKSSLPLIIHIIKFLALFYFLIVLAGVLGSLENVTISDALNRGKWLIITAVISFVIYLSIIIIGKIKMRRVENNDSIKEAIKDADVIVNKCKSELNIPFDVKEIDILLEMYENKDGSIKNINHFGAQYLISNNMIFLEDDSLCIAALENVIKIPLSHINKIIKSSDKYSFIGWNKDEYPNKNKYKGYDVVSQNNLVFTVKCYKIIIDSDFGQYYLLIPEYEYDIIISLLDIDVAEE